MSAGALLMTLLNPAEPPPEDGVPQAPPVAGPVAAPASGTTPGARVEVPLPAVQAVGDATPQAVDARARTLGAALAACSADPAGFAPADGRLELVVALGGTGLEGAHVDGIPSLGPAAAACLAAALGSGPWPHADPPTLVRVPFYVVQPVGRPDAPPAPGGAPAPPPVGPSP